MLFYFERESIHRILKKKLFYKNNLILNKIFSMIYSPLFFLVLFNEVEFIDACHFLLYSYE
jgi:hypothetical protein